MCLLKIIDFLLKYVDFFYIILVLDVRVSVHRNKNLIEITNKMRPCSRIYYSSDS